MPVSPGAILPRDMNMRQFGEFLSQSGLQGDRTVKAFTPTWNGFSVAPTGAISYMDFGAIVILWADDDRFGTSNATTFTITNLPREIIPTGARYAKCLVKDSAAVAIFSGVVGVFGNGTIQLFIDDTVTVANRIVALNNGFTASGTKGLPEGWIFMYAK